MLPADLNWPEKVYICYQCKQAGQTGLDEDQMGFTENWKDAFSGDSGVKASLTYVALPILLVVVLSSYVLRIIAANGSIELFLNMLDGWVLLSAIALILACVSLIQSAMEGLHSRLVRWPLWLVLHLVITLQMIAIALVISGFVRWRAIQVMSGLG